jgi:cell division control protein 42
MNKTINCCIIGDSNIGKSCLVESYTFGSFPRVYKPTILDVYSTLVNVGGDVITLRMFDLSGAKEGADFRREIIKNCDVTILCYSLTSLDSLENIEKYWIEEIRANNPEIPTVLVGTQSDLAHFKNRGFEPIDFKAKMLSKSLQIDVCLECSALTQQDLKNVFDQAILLCIKPVEDLEKLKKTKCIIS